MPQQSPDLFRVLPRQVDETIAGALRQWLSGKSWTEVRKLLAARRVMVNGNVCVDAGRRLKLQDVVKLLQNPAPAPPKQEDVRVRYLDSHIVVVEKPAGLTTTRHKEEQDWPARRKQIEPTLDELLPPIIARMEGGKRSKGVPPPVRPVHRLDRETSGLLVFARSVKAERNLGEQFRRHTTHRRYVAVVLGEVTKQKVTSQLVRDRGDGRRGSTDQPGVGKFAATHLRPLETIGQYTMIECRLETGRTHQIRIHLSEGGHPLCGDRVYRKPPGAAVIPDESGAPRLALHAAELGFQHPVTGETMRFEMPLPDDLMEFLKRLRKAAK